MSHYFFIFKKKKKEFNNKKKIVLNKKTNRNGNFVKEFKGQRDSVKQIRDFSIVVQKKLGILAKEEMCGAPDEEQAQIQYEQERKQAHSVKDGEGMIL